MTEGDPPMCQLKFGDFSTMIERILITLNIYLESADSLPSADIICIVTAGSSRSYPSTF